MRPLSAVCLVSLFSFLVQIHPADAAPKKYKLNGRVQGGAGYSVYFVQKSGLTRSVKLGDSGKFKFSNVKASQLKGASLQLVDPEGRYAGPVVLARKADKVSTTFSGKTLGETIAVGKINLLSGYGKVAGKFNAKLRSKPLVNADENGKPLGAGELGLVASTAPSFIGIRAEEELPGADQDFDGIPDAFDADDDGDLILDGSDSDSVGLDVPYTSHVAEFRRTLNVHVRDGLSDEAIDANISGENVFNLTFFFSLPQESSIDGGYVVCDDSLVYCRKDTPTAFYGGVSESSDEFRNKLWSELLNDDGYPRMEQINLTGGAAIVASIQPRVGRSQFRVGDVYRVVLTENGADSSSRSLALSPYFVSIPAIKEYDAGSGAVTVDYDAVDAQSGSIPGVSPGDPIVLSSGGELRVEFWRPQRAAIRSDESGYYDWGNLNYGMVIDQLQATCAGLYSNVSSELVADESPLGTGDSPFANQGANLNPYTDSIGDRAANVSNTLSFTVNLKDCVARAGGSPGVYSIAVEAAGEQVTGGRNVARQSIYVQVP